MSFTPSSSFEPATVTVAGSVSVSNFPASQAVTGPLTSAQLAALEPLSVTGPLTAAQLVAAEPLSVTGPLTDAQLAARLPLAISATALPLPTGAARDSTLTDGTQRVGGTVTVDGSGHTQPVSGTVAATQGTSPWVVDGSAVTQPISAAELPLPDGAADNDTLSEVALTAILERERLAVT